MQDIYLNKTDAEKIWLDERLYGCSCKQSDGKWIDITKVRLTKKEGKLMYLDGDNARIINGILNYNI